MNNEDHGPQAGCNYVQCGLGNLDDNCPFVKDAIPAIGGDIELGNVPSHKHEYLLVCSCGDMKPITPQIGQHGIVSIRNRGEQWMD